MPIAPESKLRAYGIDDHGLIRVQQVGLGNRRVKFVMFQFQIFVLIYQSFGFQPSKNHWAHSDSGLVTFSTSLVKYLCTQADLVREYLHRT